MRISNINLLRTNKNYQNVQNEKQSPIQNPINTPQQRKIFAYQDFNISFSGRTPENFYQQDFNRNNMPDSMKEYLFYDYENRQHIPPQQMMAEVFNYLTIADNFDDVKEIYPNENLFENLHENRQNNIKNILAEIKIAKDLSTVPLLKNGSDDLGMYLLRKIYLEGKTVKEINKDFYEKDINDEYKGVITKPIDTDVTSAYGIKFPKQAFWNSFIATREEYKKFFVTLPKNSVNPAAHVPTQKIESKEEIEDKTVKENAPKPRKYKLQTYRKKQLTDDIKNSNGTSEDIEKFLKRRFGKNDPEASFIVKYLSPIMTVASDRVNMSEELKIFNEIERIKGKQGDETYMFTRFWKNNPRLRVDFAHSITDTIEMFENIYASGGSIPINSDLEMVTPDSENQKPIDYVSSDFFDFLDKIKNLEIERLDRYSEHDRLQSEWENYFDQKDSIESQNDEILNSEEVSNENNQLSPEELLQNTAEQFGAEVITIKGKNGEDFRVTTNIDGTFKEFIERSAKIFPPAYAKLFVNYMLSKDFSREFKLSFSLREYIDKIDPSDPNIIDTEQCNDILLTALRDFYIDNINESKAADSAFADALCIAGVKDKQKVFSFNSLNYLLGSSPKEFYGILNSNKTKFNNLYNLYKRPLSGNEQNKVVLTFMDFVEHYDNKNSIVKSDTQALLLMLRDMINVDKESRRLLRKIFDDSISLYPYTKAVLNKDIPKEFRQARCEYSITPVILDFLDTDIFIQILNKETVDKYFDMLSPEAKQRFNVMEQNISLYQREFYYTPTNMISTKFNAGYKLLRK